MLRETDGRHELVLVLEPEVVILDPQKGDDLASGQDHSMFRVRLPRTHEEAHVTFSAEGLARLRNGLAKAGLSAVRDALVDTAR